MVLYIFAACTRVYLSCCNGTQRGLTFSDLNSEESRKMFNKFVRHWNAGKLDEVRLAFACHSVCSIEFAPVIIYGLCRAIIKVWRQLT